MALTRSWDVMNRGDGVLGTIQGHIDNLNQQGSTNLDQEHQYLSQLERLNRILQDGIRRCQGGNVQWKQMFTHKTSAWTTTETRCEQIEQHHAEIAGLRQDGSLLLAQLDEAVQTLRTLRLHDSNQNLEGLSENAEALPQKLDPHFALTAIECDRQQQELERLQQLVRDEEAELAGAEQAIEAEEEAVTRVAEATQALEKQIESTRMDLQQAQQQLQTREAEWTALQERDRNLRITNPMIKKQVDALKVLGSELEQARSLTQDQQTQLAEAQIREIEIDHQLDELRNRVQQLRRTRDGLLDNQKEAQAEWDRLDALQQQQPVGKATEAAEAREEHSGTSLDEQITKAQAYKLDLENLQLELEETEKQVAEAETMLEKSLSHFQEARNQAQEKALGRQQQLDDLLLLRQQVCGQLALLEAAERACKVRNSQLETLQADLGKQTGQVSAAKVELAAAEERAASLQKQLDEEEKQLSAYTGIQAEMQRRDKVHKDQMEGLGLRLATAQTDLSKRTREITNLMGELNRLFSTLATLAGVDDTGGSGDARKVPRTPGRPARVASAPRPPLSTETPSTREVPAAEKAVTSTSRHRASPKATPRKRTRGSRFEEGEAPASALSGRRGTKRLKQAGNRSASRANPVAKSAPGEEDVFVPSSPPVDENQELSQPVLEIDQPQKQQQPLKLQDSPPAAVARRQQRQLAALKSPVPPSAAVMAAMLATPVRVQNTTGDGEGSSNSASQNKGSSSGLRRLRRSKKVLPVTSQEQTPAAVVVPAKGSRNATSWFDDEDMFAP